MENMPLEDQEMKNKPVYKDSPLITIIIAASSVLYGFFTGTDIDQDMLGRGIDTIKHLSDSPVFLVISGVIGLYAHKKGWLAPDRADDEMEKVEAGTKEIADIVLKEIRKELAEKTDG